MRELIPLVAVAGCFLNCNAAFAQIQVCDDVSNCKTFSSQQDADRYVEDLAREKEAQARDIVLHMPIDYRDCILPALLDEMLPLAKKGTEHFYVADMDKELRAKLAEHGVRVAGVGLSKENQGTSKPHSPHFVLAFQFSLHCDFEAERRV